MSWRLAKSLMRLREQINELSPNRSKISDGTIGDTAHSNRKSDHNPDNMGIVRALDITHDPEHGIDSEKLANALLRSQDSRIKYIISNRKIASGANGPAAWVWRPYKGSNPHSKHVHISVVGDAKADVTADWDFELTIPDEVKEKPITSPSHPLLKRGSKGHHVKNLQRLLNDHGARLAVDGDFGPKTEAAVRKFQRLKELVVDGIVGPYTWAAF